MREFAFVRLAIGAGVLVLVGATGAVAQEGVVVKSLLGAVGILPKDRPPIQYNERAPLVLPPKLDLRPPASPTDLEARGNWPRDPDVAAARKDSFEARAPERLTSAYRNSEAKRLSIEEIEAGRRVGGRASAFDPAANDRRSDMSRMSPVELRSFSTQEKAPSDRLERQALTDPPDALLKAVGGKKLKATRDLPTMGDPDSPAAFQRQQSGRR
jgi:hypothetical protein